MTCPIENGPGELAVLTITSCGAPLVLENTQVKSAPAFMLAAGIKRVEPVNVPIDPMFPVVALLASVQLAELMKNPPAAASVNVVFAPNTDALIMVGDAGVAVAAVRVVIAPGVETRLV